MRTVIETKDILTFEELDNAAKNKVRDSIRANYEFSDELVLDDANWIYRKLESDYNYYMSDKYIRNCIYCNDYEFTADGKIYEQVKEI